MKWDPTSNSVYRGEYFSLWVWHVQRSCGRRSCGKKSRGHNAEIEGGVVLGRSREARFLLTRGGGYFRGEQASRSSQVGRGHGHIK